MRSFYLWLAFISLFVLGLGDNGRGPVFPDILTSFHLSDSKGALFFFIGSFCGFLITIAAKLWLPRFGAYRSLQAFLVILATGHLIMAGAANFAVLILGGAVFGVAMGGLGVVQNILVGQTAEASHQRRAYSLLHCMYGASSFVAPLLVTAVYKAQLGWSGCFVIFSIFSLSLLVVTFFKAPPEGGRDILEKKAAPLVSNEIKRVLWASLLVWCYVFAEVIISTRLVLYLRRELGFEIEKANNYLAAFFAFLLIGRLIFALIEFPLSTIRVLRLSVALSLFCFLLGLFVHPLWLSVTALAMSPFFPCLMSLVKDEFPRPEKAETAFTWVFTAHAFGSASMNFIAGGLTDLIGLPRALVCGPIMLVIIGGALMWPSKGLSQAKTANFPPSPR